MKTRRLPFFLIASAMFAGLAMERPPQKPSPTPVPAVATPTPAVFPTPPAALVVPEDTRPFKNAPDAAGIKVEAAESTMDEETEQITQEVELTVLFPDAMVSPDRIDAEDAGSPLVIWPDVDAQWIWRTQSQGVWRVKGPLIPDQQYHVRLREGLSNLAGSPLPVADWGYPFTTSPLTVTSDFDEREQLSARPQVPLGFTFPVRLHDAAEGIWFQNRATRQRFPAEVLLNRAESTTTGDVVDITNAADIPAPKSFRVRPREPLPVGVYYDLVVENVFDAYAGRTLPYPEVFALGTTRPLAVDFVAARNWPTDKPHIEVKFTAPLGDDELPTEALKIEPAVPNLALRREGQSLLAAGDFDTAVRYKVTISNEVVGEPGFALAKAETWGATFQPKKPTVLFPTGILRQRASLGLRFALLQANTGPITWRLAPIPLDRVEEVQVAMKEPTKPLIDALHLEVTGQGEIAASDNDREVVRRIEWKPASGQPQLSGPYLMEAIAKTSTGTTVENRSLIYFNETVFTQKTMPTGTALRIAGMADGKPMPGTTVKLLTGALAELGQGVTDEFGVVFFPAAALTGSAFFVAETPSGPSVESSVPGSSFSDTGSTYARTPDVWLGEIVTDRPLYRPGEEVHFKGFLRHNGDERLTIPQGKTVTWQIVSSDRDEKVGEGLAKLNAFGGWDGVWTSPPQGKLGEFRISAKIGAEDAGDGERFRIEEFRNPAFSVVCEISDATQPALSTVNISSQYFHGAPNVGSSVKWKATWIGDSDGEYYDSSDSEGFTEVDLYSEHRRTPAYEVEISGETALDAKGRATLTSTAPFKDPGLRAHSTVLWRVDVTGPDGQTITGGAEETVTMNDVTLGVRPDRETGKTDIAFDLRATTRDESSTPPAEVQAAFFLVQTKSVKERLAPFTYRYRNTDEYISIEKKNVPANGRLVFTPKTPGRYVLVVAPLKGQAGITVSENIYLSGEGEAQLPVKSDEKLQIKAVAGDKPVPIGADAAFDVLSPSPGIAWVTVETDRVLDTFTIPLPGNSTRIEVPVKPGYAPNVHVSAYVLRPGNTDDLPGEMYGASELKVEQPGTTLDLAIATDKPEYEPRQTGKITVRATNIGKPAPGAEVTLYAVDDSILTLGGWTLPTLLDTFFSDHPFNVVTRIALAGYIESISEGSLTMKEAVVGESGKDEFGNTRFVRQNFRPIILWLPSVVTGSDGTATAEFTTPDNLTRFRVIALAQTKENQFGSGDGTFNVTKPLIIEPALPRFLRQGDEVEFRAVARQKSSPEEKLTIQCDPGVGLTLTGPAAIERTVTKNDPAVATFPARVADGATSATIRFTVKSGDRSDEVEVTIPVASRTITVRESTAGTWSGPVFDPSKQAPPAWSTSPGEFDVTLSTSPWLAKLLGIPVVLDYPHGCFEQKSSRLLVYTALAKLLAFLPQPQERDENYRRVIDETLREFEKSLLPDETLPYWPFGTEGNAYVTIQAAWAVAQAEQAGFEVPEGLSYALPASLKQMALRKSRLEVDPTLRAFALCILSQLEAETDDELTAAANELFLGRDRLTDEGRAMLAIAFHTWELEPDHQQELVREFPEKFGGRKFNPVTFSSSTRAEAICTWARLLITPETAPERLEARLEAQMSNSTSLSTQENLWLLIAFNALLEQKPPAKLNANVAPQPDAVSTNASAASWVARNLTKLRDMMIRNAGKSGAYVLAARRQLAPEEQKAVDKGMRIERIVKNLTDATRTGTTQAPFKLGDQVLISFRFHSDEPQSFVAVENALPAGLEVLNPNLEMIGKFYQIPDEPGMPAAWLSFSEMRDKQTNLYFDTMPAGAQSYAILARVTAAGTFAWPSTQMSPMYDSRSYARSAPSQCVVVSQ
jgi:alpha-2-macroglobulin